MSTAIHWFRRDLRLTDNTALACARADHTHVVPAYIVSTWRQHHHWTGAPRQEFLCGSLAELSRALAGKGSRLIIRTGDAVEELLTLAREAGAEAIYFNRDPDPFGRAVEARLAQAAPEHGIAIHSRQDIGLHERDSVLTGTGHPFRVFTPYAKAWLKLEKPAPGRTIGALSTPPLRSEPLPTLATWQLTRDAEITEPGEAAARRRLDHFLDGAAHQYGACRDFPGEAGTSRLSQDLRYGTLSIREVYAKCRAAAAAVPPASRRHFEIFINELIWRDFYLQVLWHWPEVLEHEFNADYRGMKWTRAGDPLESWKAGQTGFPIVDAGMRQLQATGFMHNRVRMITAMFLTKDLHLDWRTGEQWFMQRLTDGEIASNNGGWQWSASTGTDAAPYFRIQNPWSQTTRFDPDGIYIKRWIPELRDVSARDLIEPPASGQPLAKGYPTPIVDHHREREAALEMYRHALSDQRMTTGK